MTHQTNQNLSLITGPNKNTYKQEKTDHTAKSLQPTKNKTYHPSTSNSKNLILDLALRFPPVEHPSIGHILPYTEKVNKVFVIPEKGCLL